VTKRVLKYMVQAILGVYDEDGNLIDEEVQPVEPLYFRFGIAIENLTARIEKLQQAAPEQRR
jgi:hypothetical protein